MRRWIWVISTLGATLVAPLSGAAASAQPDPHVRPNPDFERPRRPNIEPLGPGRFRIGTILLDKTSRTLRMPANVNMREGMVELVACSSGGKLHESVFLARVEPYDLQIALLLLNLRQKGDPKRPQGDRVAIFVERDRKRRRVEEFIWDMQRKTTMERTGWLFIGSKILDDGQFAAQLTRTLITTYNDPYTILDNPLDTGTDDTVYEANPRVVPAVGTTVTLVIQPLKVALEKEKKDGAKSHR